MLARPPTSTLFPYTTLFRSLTGNAFPSVTDQVTGTQTSPNQVADPVYVWANTIATGNYFLADASAVNNRDYYLELPNISNLTTTFNGTAGIGSGTLSPSTSGAYANAPNCTTGVGYWDATSQKIGRASCREGEK